MTAGDHHQQQSLNFGGQWTLEKLDVLETYLDAYTTALKNQQFRLMYIDAFAGTGRFSLSKPSADDASTFVSGSAERALRIGDKPFDRLVFIESSPRQCEELRNLKEYAPGRDIQIEQSDANQFLSQLQENWRRWRGVLFLDPFATEVEWSTIETIASFEALDTWILFPTSAIARMLPKSKQPDDISAAWSDRLTRVYGNENWRELYRQKLQMNLFGVPGVERDHGVEGLIKIYKGNLKRLLGNRFLERSRTLKRNNSPLFEFMFFVGHPNGIGPATRIAEHILKDL
ncbi:MAG: three-Cys-motif partner protein TcmP [Bryobacterales bacterium]|nr:three-Cys-motif partner protein TcmP [Bryobacterales bacterium]